MKIAISYKSDRMELSVHARFSRVKGTISNPPRQQHKPEHPEQPGWESCLAVQRTPCFY